MKESNLNKNESIIHNVSIGKSNITEQRHKTITSIFDENIENLSVNGQQVAQQNQSILNWLIKIQQSVIKPMTNVNIIPDRSPAFYMISIDEIGPITYKRQSSQTHSKLYLKLICNLYDTVRDQYLNRTVTTPGYQLHLFQNNLIKYYQPERISLYFYTYRSSNISLRVDCIVYESLYGSNRKQQIIVRSTNIGTMLININNVLKTKQKQYFWANNYPIKDTKLDTQLQYGINISDTYKILQKLIPCECLVSSEDEIDGIIGRKLPNNQFIKIQYIELLSLKIDIQQLCISTHIINTQIPKITNTIINGMMKAQYIKVLSNNIKQYRLHCHFHNGWKIVNTSSVVIKQAMQIHKKTQNKNPKSQLIKLTKFNCDEVLELPFVFLSNHSMIVLEVQCRVQVHLKNEQPFSKQQKNTNIQMLDISLGCCYHPLCSYPKAEYKNIKILMNSNSVYNVSTNRTHYGQKGEGHHNYSQNQQILHQNDQHSSIQYYVHVDHINKMQFSKHLGTPKANNSKVVQFKDKIELQKERIVKENQRIKKQTRKKKIQLNQQMPVIDINEIRQETYISSLEHLKKEKKEKEDILNFLKEKYQKYIQKHQEEDILDDHHQHQHYLDPLSNKKKLKNHHNAVYVQSILRKQQQKIQKQINNTNSTFINGPDLTSIEQIPIQILKTELVEVQYSYLFLINFISLIPTSKINLIPRKFYFRVKLFTNSLFTVNLYIDQHTGQIMVVSEKKAPESHKEVINSTIGKTMHKRVQFNDSHTIKVQDGTDKKLNTVLHLEIMAGKSNNYKYNFLKFIQYLYNGYMEIVVIDAQKNIQFGSTYFQLRQLIKKRRNEVNHIQQQKVYNNNSNSSQSKAKLKVSFRVLRKQIEQNQKIPVNNVVYTPTSIQERQMQRIKRYKGSVDKQYNIKMQTLNRAIQSNYVQKDITISVSKMCLEYIFIEIQNKNDYHSVFTFTLADQHQQYFTESQISVIYDINIIPKIIPLPTNLMIINTDTIELNPRQKVTLPFSYRTFRKYYSLQQTNDSNPSPVIYNLPHYITLTVLSNSKIVSLHRISILQCPDYNSFNISLCRKRNYPTRIIIDFNYLLLPKYKVFIDDPQVVTSFDCEGQEQQKFIMECMVGDVNKKRQINLSIYDQDTNKIARNLRLQLWGAQEIIVEGILWRTTQVMIEIPTHLIVAGQTYNTLIICQDEKTISCRQKNPFKINPAKSYSYARFLITPNCIGCIYNQVILLHPFTRAILHRYIAKIHTEPKAIKQYCILKIKSTDKLLEQPFAYQNSLPRKATYQFLSSNPELVWCSTDSIQLDVNGEKKITIKINAEKVKNGDSVVIGFKSDSILDYIMFQFQKKQPQKKL